MTNLLFIVLCSSLQYQDKNAQEMERLLSSLESLPSHKELIKIWCKQNKIKVSFLVTMTLSKAKSLYSKLQKMYQKNSGVSVYKWLENQLKLFHFCLLAVSTLYETKIIEFNQQQKDVLQAAFPHKKQATLDYETINFISEEETLKRKWTSEENQILAEIVKSMEGTVRWSQVAVELFAKSETRYFRNSKQCRERWLNHLDQSIKHEKWNEEEDRALIQFILLEGKQWSQIMRHFKNQRTQHMIKNRFISLVLKTRKQNPTITNQESILLKIAEDMNIRRNHQDLLNKAQMEQKLRNRQTAQSVPKPTKTVQQPKLQDLHKQIQHFEENGSNVASVGDHSKTLPITPIPSFMAPAPYLTFNPFAYPDYFQIYLNTIEWNYQ